MKIEINREKIGTTKPLNQYQHPRDLQSLIISIRGDAHEIGKIEDSIRGIVKEYVEKL